MLASASAIPATMKIHPIAFFGRLLTITMPRTGTPRLTNTSRTSEALQTATLLGRSLPRSTNISTRAASSSTIETIPTDQANLRAVHVVMPPPTSDRAFREGALVPGLRRAWRSATPRFRTPSRATNLRPAAKPVKVGDRGARCVVGPGLHSRGDSRFQGGHTVLRASPVAGTREGRGDERRRLDPARPTWTTSPIASRCGSTRTALQCSSSATATNCSRSATAARIRGRRCTRGRCGSADRSGRCSARCTAARSTSREGKVLRGPATEPVPVYETRVTEGVVEIRPR